MVIPIMAAVALMAINPAKQLKKAQEAGEQMRLEQQQMQLRIKDTVDQGETPVTGEPAVNTY